MLKRTFEVNLEISTEDIKKRLLSLPTKIQAQEFYEYLCLVYNGNKNYTCQGIASAEHISEKLNLDLSITKKFCNAMRLYGITERQGGCYVI